MCTSALLNGTVYILYYRSRVVELFPVSLVYILLYAVTWKKIQEYSSNILVGYVWGKIFVFKFCQTYAMLCACDHLDVLILPVHFKML